MTADINNVSTYHGASLGGWFEGQACQWAALEGQKHKTIVEIGCWAGRSTACFCEFAGPDTHVWTVDHFKGSSGYDERKTTHKEAADDRAMVIARAFTNLKPYINNGRLDIVVMDGCEAAKCWPIIGRGREIDLLFIDADHATDALLSDIRAWKPYVRSGGIIAGHDSIWDTVKAALNEALPGWRQGPGCVWLWDVP